MTEHAGSPTIDELSDRVRAAGSDVEAQSALWRAMFGLEKWWFVARGTLPAVAPLVGTVDGAPSLLTFTSAKRAADYAVASGLTPDIESTQVISTPPASALESADHLLAQGVQRLVVDQGTLGFFAPLGQLRAMHDFVSRG